MRPETNFVNVGDGDNVGVIFKLDNHGNLVWEKSVPSSGPYNTVDFSGTGLATPNGASWLWQVTKANDGYIAVGELHGAYAGFLLVEVDEYGNFLNGTPLQVIPPLAPTMSTIPYTVSSSTVGAQAYSVAIDPNTHSVNNIIVGARVEEYGFNGAGIISMNYSGSAWALGGAYYAGNNGGSTITKILTKSTGTSTYDIYACGALSGIDDNETVSTTNLVGPTTVTTFDKDVWLLSIKGDFSAVNFYNAFNKYNILLNGTTGPSIDANNSTTYPYQDFGPLTARNQTPYEYIEGFYCRGSGYPSYPLDNYSSNATYYFNFDHNENEFAGDMIFAADGNIALMAAVNVIGANPDNMGGMDGGSLLGYTGGAAYGYAKEYQDEDGFLLKFDLSGNLLNAKNVGHFSGINFNLCIRQDLEGHYIIGGSTADKYGTYTYAYGMPNSFTPSGDYNLPQPQCYGDAALLIATDDNFPGTGDLWRRAFTATDPRAATDGNSEVNFCLFGLDLTADGGYVIGGNNTNNGDDFSVTKFAPLHQELMVGASGSGGYCTFGGSAIPPEYDVTTSETWPSTNVPTGSNIATRVVVESGHTLTINSGTFNFAASDQLWDYYYAPDNYTSLGGVIGCGIVVEPGGILNINSGAILQGISISASTAPPGEHNVWDGIVVQGLPTSTATTTDQGQININGGTITDARCGVFVADAYRDYSRVIAPGYGITTGANYSSRYDGTTNLGGGIVAASNGILQNCEYGAIFENMIYPNTSTFTGCAFSSTAAGMGDICFYTDRYGSLLPSNTFIAEWQQSNVNLYENTFTSDLSFTPIELPIGVEATASGLWAVIPAGSGYTGNTFSNLSQGIQLNEGAQGLIFFDFITNNIFDNNLTGINASGKANDLLIQYNQINLPVASIAYGINLAGCHGYDVSNNTFDHTTTASTGWGYGGILVNDGTTFDETINNNTFNHIEIANLADQLNGSAATVTGLQYRCNVFNQDVENISMVSSIPPAPTYSCVIRPHQGTCLSGTTPAGNQFDWAYAYLNLAADVDVVEAVTYNNNYSGSEYDPGGSISSIYTNIGCGSGLLIDAPTTSAACPASYDYTNPSHLVVLGGLGGLDATMSVTTDPTIYAELQTEHNLTVAYLARYYAMNGMYDSAAIMLAGYGMYRDALPFYLTMGDYIDAWNMQASLPMVTGDDSLYAWEAGIAITLYSGGHTWLDVDTTSLGIMTRLVQYNKAAGYMAGGTDALLGTGPVTWPYPGTDSTTLDTLAAITTRHSGDRTAGGTITHNTNATVSNANNTGMVAFSAYPNPTYGSLTITTTGSGSFELYTIEGQLLQKYTVANGVTDILLPPSLAAGLYMGVFRADSGGVANTVRLVYQP